MRSFDSQTGFHKPIGIFTMLHALSLAQGASSPRMTGVQAWPHRIGSTIRFFHVSSKLSEAEQPLIIERNRQFLRLSVADQLKLAAFIKFEAITIPSLHSDEYDPHDRLMMFFEEGDSVQHLKAQTSELLGDGFNDALWENVVHQIAPEGKTSIVQAGVIDITPIRDRAVKNMLESSVGSEVQPYVTFVQWVKAQLDQEPLSPLCQSRSRG